MSAKTGSNQRLMEDYSSCYDDGLLDMFIGMGVLAFGFCVATDRTWVAAIYPVVIIPLWQFCRRMITVPRLRNAARTDSQQVRRNLERAAYVSVAALATVTLGGILLLWAQLAGRVSAEMQAWLDQHLVLFAGLAGALLSATAGWLSGIRRLYGYALLAASLFSIGHWLRASPAPLLLATGSAILLAGAIFLIRFVRSSSAASVVEIGKMPLEESG